jgi:hypothetical protein
MVWRDAGAEVGVGEGRWVALGTADMEGSNAGVTGGGVAEAGRAVAAGGVRLGSSSASGAGDSGGGEGEGVGVVAPQAASHTPVIIVTVWVRRNKSRLARDLFHQLGA